MVISPGLGQENCRCFRSNNPGRTHKLSSGGRAESL
jgi:hypothetical protein